MFDPIFSGILWTLVLCVIMPVVVRLIKWRGMRYLLMSILMIQIAIGIGIMIDQPYALEDITDHGGRVISNPNLVINPAISWLFLASVVIAWSLLFTRSSDREVLWSSSTELLVVALLIATSFYVWCFSSLEWMDDEKREKIYDQLGGHG